MEYGKQKERQSEVAGASATAREIESSENELVWRDLLRAVLEMTTVAAVVSDAEGHVVLVNSAAKQLFGGAAPIEGAKWKDGSLHRPDGSPMPANELPLARALQQGEETKNMELLLRLPNRTTKMLRACAGAIRDRSGNTALAVSLFEDVTEAFGAETTRSRLAAIVESTSDAVTSADLTGVVRTWNAGAERLYGYRAEEMIGKSIGLLIPMENTGELAQVLECVKKGGRVEHMETVRVRKDGSIVEVSLTVSPLVMGNGQIGGISWIAHDISGRKHMEREARANEERLRSIYREAPIGIELYDAAGRLVDANEACLELFGVAKVDNVKDFNLFTDPNVSSEAKSRLLRGETVRYQGVFDFAKVGDRYETSRGGKVYLDVLITPLGPREGKPVSGYLVHVQDVTERVLTQEALEKGRNELEARVAQRTSELAESNVQLRAEAAQRKRLVIELREGNEQLTAATMRWKEQAQVARRRADERETTIASIADGVFLCDREGRVVDVNEAGLRLLGLAEDQVLNKELVELLRVLDLRHPDGQQFRTDELPLSHALRGHAVKGFEEVAHSMATGMDVNLLVSAAPIYDQECQIAGAVEVMSDISRIKELDRLKDQFISVAAHELKTPVAIMKGYAQALLREGEDITGSRRRMLEAINRGSDKIDRVVKDLLDVSRLHLGRMELAIESIDLAALVEEVADRMSLTAPKHQLRIVAADPVVVQGDKDRLEQVIVNIIDNAVKYSPRGGKVELAVRRNGEAVVSARDYGIGIPAEKQASIFERFYRAHSGTPYDYGGMGVGLYISKQIVERHGGRMWFESKVNEGSTFYFSLPLPSGEPKRAENPQAIPADG